jgi:transposase-like protein
MQAGLFHFTTTSKGDAIGLAVSIRVTPTPLPTADHPLRPEANFVSACPNCSGTNWRPNGSYTNSWNETREAVECRDCSRGFYLALGQHLPRKVASPVEEVFAVADEDSRPTCPLCSGTDVQRRGIIHLRTGGTTQRWLCRPCNKRFVSAAHRVASVDRRTLSHWDSVSPADEARFLYRFALRYCAVDDIRKDIEVSDAARADLELLIADGALTRNDVEDALEFRAKVLEAFDGFARAAEPVGLAAD